MVPNVYCNEPCKNVKISVKVFVCFTSCFFFLYFIYVFLFDVIIKFPVIVKFEEALWCPFLWNIFCIFLLWCST